MKITIKSIIIALALITSIFVAYGIFSNDVEAYDWGGSGSSCGNCGGDYGGGGDPGGPNPEPNCTTHPNMAQCQPKPKAKCDFLSANPTKVNYGGGNVSLAWETTNATSVSINQGIGSVAADGSTSVFVDSDTTFVLTAVGTGGNDSCSATVTVKPEEKVAKCDFLNASDTRLNEGGETITLSWGTTNATSVSINHGIGSVSADGSTSVFVDDDTTFILTATGTNGSDNCSVTVYVDEDEDRPARCDYFRISDDEVEEGDEVTLRWETTNADEVYINNGIGRVSADGSERVRVYDDETWTLTVEGVDGDEDTCRVSVEVEEDDDEPRPRCELEISDDKVRRGDRVTLEWDTTNADDVVIKDDRGEVIFDSDDYSRRYLDGEIDVIINRDTEFTLNARGDGGRRECEVEVEVEDDITVFEKREQPYVISLTQVPYTGFEAGPTLTFIFYALITLWALFVAYILVIKRGSVLGFSLYGATANSAVTAEADAEYKKKVAELVAKYSHRPLN